MQANLNFLVLFASIFSVRFTSATNSTVPNGDEERFGYGPIRKFRPAVHGSGQCKGSAGYQGHNLGYPRFSKVQMNAKEPYRIDFLTPNDYPIQYSCKLDAVRNSFCPSVTVPSDYEVKDDIAKMVQLVGYPSHPFDGYGHPDPYFWEEFKFLVILQIYRRHYGNKEAYHVMPFLPDLWRSYTLNQVALAVHDEFPGLHQSEMLAANSKTKNPSEASGPFHLELDPTLIGKRCRTRFLHSIVAMAKFLSYAVDKVAPTNFAAKYYCGRARPEEIAWKIAIGELTEKDGVPGDIIRLVLSMKLKKMEEFTAYPEGCPQHPSYPAMHSAASSISVILIIVSKFKITDYELDQAIKTDVAVACARTVAGVHFVSDNTSGLKMGQRVLHNHLPQYMAEHYDADPAVVRDKIKKVAFLWDYYVDAYCNIQLPPNFDPYSYAGGY